MRLWPQALRTRLMLVMVTGLLLALIASGVIHWYDRGRFVRQANVDQFVSRVEEAVKLIEESSGSRRDVYRILQSPPFHAHPVPHFPERRHIGRHQDPLAKEIEGRLREVFGGSRRVLVHFVELRPVRDVLPMPPRGAPGGIIAVVELADRSAVRLVYRLSIKPASFPARLLVSLVVLLLAAILLSWLAVRFVSGPLKLAIAQAGRLGEDLDAPPMSGDGPQEIRQLAEAMNGMQSGLKKMFEERGRFLAAISHDLRTPITRMRLRLEMLDDDEQREALLSDLVEMEHMVQETLEFMRDDRQSEPQEQVDLGALIESQAHDFEAQGLGVELELAEQAIIQGRPMGLRRCFANLLANAFRYAGSVRITLARDFDGGYLVVMEDDGPGIPEEELERVFEPFYRGDKSRTDGGSGLGLSIARNIILNHGGAIELYKSREGGLGIRIRLPANPGEAV